MPADSLSTTFAALAAPSRRAILARLAVGETSVAELATPFHISPPAATKHLKVLQRAGLIEQYRQHWEQSFDRLDSYLQQLQAQEAQLSPGG